MRTVSDTLNAYIHDSNYSKNWDTTLNYIAFNMKQVACSTLGFSPHQLVFGKNLRSEIDELRDRFLGLATNDCQRQRQVTEFMLDLQKRLKTANDLAKQNAAKQQQKTCLWYDKKAKPKVFAPGDYCLVLVADDNRKLFARWSQRAEVIRRVSETSYEISLNNKRDIKHVSLIACGLSGRGSRQAL